MKVKCIIVDDEPLAIEVLKNHIAKMEVLEVVGHCQHALEAYDLITRRKPDLLFLDIQMPGMKGTDFLRNLKNPPPVILTTAYREYAIEGYELDVVDYLVKPISFERFFKAVSKFLALNSEAGTITLRQSTGTTEGFIYVKVNKKVHKIMLKDICYAESVKDYITIHTVNRKITARHTLSAFIEMLPEKDFLRIHRSFVVSVSHITGFTASAIDVDGVELPIGRNFSQQVFNVLQYNPPEE